jgi:hypothetical protein
LLSQQWHLAQRSPRTGSIPTQRATRTGSILKGAAITGTTGVTTILNRETNHKLPGEPGFFI